MYIDRYQYLLGAQTPQIRTMNYPPAGYVGRAKSAR